MDPQFIIECQILVQSLDTVDYFQLLKLPQEATQADVKRAYYAESRVYHPDKYYHLDNTDLKDDIHRIYKRITEAYTVLRNPEHRAKYLADINGENRSTKLRYTEESEAELKKQKDEFTGKTPQAKQCYRQAVQDIQAKRWEAAENQLKTALMYESDNELFKEKMALVVEEIRKAPKKSDGGFAIK